MKKHLLVLVLAALSVWFCGCSGGGDGVISGEVTADPPGLDSGAGIDLKTGDSVAQDLNSEDGAIRLSEAATLAFHDEFGDDGELCQGQDICRYHVYWNLERQFKVVLKDQGLPVADHPIKWSISTEEDLPDQIAVLGVGNLMTNQQGVASVTLTTRSISGLLHLKAEVPGTDIPPLTFLVTVTCKCPATLNVLLDYHGSKPLTTGRVYLFKKAVLEGCEGLEPDDLPNPYMLSSFQELASRFSFSVLDQWNPTAGLDLVLLGVGLEAEQGPVAAFGCLELNPINSFDSAKSVVLELQDHLSR